MDNDGGGSSGARQNGKKSGHRHSPQQIERLEAYFKRCPHPNESQRQQLSQELNLEADQIKFWFQNKRTQSKTQDDRSKNILLREKNERLESENAALREALQNLYCPGCGGPLFGREPIVQQMHLENARLKEELDKLARFVYKHMPKRPIAGDSFASVPSQQIFDHLSNGINPSNLYEPSSSLGPPTSQTIQPQPQFQMDIRPTSQTIQPQPLSQMDFQTIQPQSQIDIRPTSQTIQPQPQSQMDIRPTSQTIQPQPLSQMDSQTIQPQPQSQMDTRPTSQTIQPQPQSQMDIRPTSQTIQPQPLSQMDSQTIQPQPQSQMDTRPTSQTIQPQPQSQMDIRPTSQTIQPQPLSQMDSQTIQPQPLSQMDISLLSKTAAIAVEELKRLFFIEEQFWVKSSIDGAYIIDSQSYETSLHAVKHLRSTSVHVESSKDFTVVPIEAKNLIEMFLDSEKWKELFPTIVSKAETIYALGSERPIRENCNVVQVMWEQLHILSPLVPPREFMIVRCCQEIDNGVWIIADVSHDINFDFVSASCYKRPSGCLIQTLPNDQSKVTWIEHVEVDRKLDADKMYRELLSGGSGYGARRWIVSLERLSQRMALFSSLTLPASDWNEIPATGEGRRSVMKLGERMLKNFNEMLTMSGQVEFPQQSNCGVRVSIRPMNQAVGQPSGLVVSAVSTLLIPLTPLQVYIFLRDLEARPQWDSLSRGTVVSEIARIGTGSSETNCLTILRPMQGDSNRDSDKDAIVTLQDSFMDPLGGMIVYAPIDIAMMKLAVSGEADPSHIPILPSGFIISSDGRRSTAEDGGTLLTVALHILVSCKTTMSREVNEKWVHTVIALISSTVQRIKGLLNLPQ